MLTAVDGSQMRTVFVKSLADQYDTGGREQAHLDIEHLRRLARRNGRTA